MSYLILDIGNTKVKAAVVENDVLSLVPSRANIGIAWLTKFFAERRISKTILVVYRSNS